MKAAKNILVYVTITRRTSNAPKEYIVSRLKGRSTHPCTRRKIPKNSASKRIGNKTAAQKLAWEMDG
jgi:hypothetical protein